MPSSEYNHPKAKGQVALTRGAQRAQEMWTPSVQLEKRCHSVNGDKGRGGGDERTECGW